MTQFRVGHSHWKVDQRFAEVRTVLSDSKELQNLERVCAGSQISAEAQTGQISACGSAPSSVGFQDHGELPPDCSSWHLNGNNTSWPVSINVWKDFLLSFLLQGFWPCSNKEDE